MKASVRRSIGKYLRIMKRTRASRVALSVYEKLNKTLVESDSKTASKLYLRSRRLALGITGLGIRFVTLNELFVWTNEWLRSFPTTYDVIVGIPRSGLLVAGIIATKLGKPLTTPELFVQDRFWGKEDVNNKKREYKRILLVDDTIDRGTTIEENFQLLHSHFRNLNITKAVLIATETSKDSVDLYHKIIPYPRAYEWNFLDSKTGKLGSDLDGVLCENCPPGVDEDEKLYTAWIKNAKPYLIPKFEIDIIVSSRLEKYRSDTVKWLARYGVRYKELFLWGIQSKEERRGRNAQHKIEVFLKKKPDMIWESSFHESKQIWEATKIPTLCIDEMILLS
jgi:hypothetical protein